MGVETEYALGGVPKRHDLVKCFVATLKKRVPHLRGGSSADMFLQNGARFYVDCGSHPELSTPECTSPADIVRYIRAGERMLAGSMDEMKSKEAWTRDGLLFTCNVDYSGAKTTWGSHESYLYRRDPSVFPAQIIPFLVSRVVYAGAGGFDPFSTGIDFTLSPRACHLQHDVSGESTHNRGIFHTKDETLSRTGTHRLHLLCGESLRSDIATYVRIGATALVVSLIDAGGKPGRGIDLRSPVKTLRQFAADPTCAVKARTRYGRQLSAIDIQRHYLGECEERVGAGDMPAWGAEVCHSWRTLLDGLENDPETLSTTIDWPIKLAVFKRHAASQGIRWEDVPAWNHVTSVVKKAIRASKHKGMASVELVLGRTREKSPIPDTIEQLTPYVEEHDLSWDSLRPFVDLRQELFELDIRFGEVGSDGIFNQLDAAGVLTHAAPGVDDVDGAVTSPPAEGRARLRGEKVREFAGAAAYRCYWDSISDMKGGRVMEMHDPFGTEAEWKEHPQRKSERGREQGAPIADPLRLRALRARRNIEDELRDLFD